MTQEFRPEPPPPDPIESAGGHDPASDDVVGLASMLSDAFDAPPVPSSLVQKINDGIEEQWGHSPELVPSRGGGATVLAEKGYRWIRSWPVAVGLAATLVLAFVIAGGSKTYAWAAVVEAMARRGLIEMPQDGGVRWLDLANRVVGQQSDQQTQWIDLRQRVVLTRLSESDTLQRKSLAIADSGENADQLLAAFFLGQPMSAETLDRLRGVKVVAQQWKRQQRDGRDYIDLNVSFEAESSESFSLDLQLDPESSLPLAVAAGGVDVASSTPIVYLDTSSTDLKAVHFPSNLTVVEVAEASDDQIASASIERSVDSERPDGTPPALASEGDPVNADQPDPTRVAVADAEAPDRHHLATASLPIGAANKWSPVAVLPKSDAAVLEQVNLILDQLWQREQVRPVAQATDLELLRRAYLDLAGRTPTVTEVRRFINDPGADRYERLIDELLSSPDHASQMAAVWRSFLIPEGVDLDAFGGREAFEQWLAERFSGDEPYDQLVRKLLLAEGRLSQSGPLLFYTALKLDAHQLAARTSRAFLGMRLECAQCHDHPFEPWSQEDFWSYAAFFAQISRPKGELESVSSVMRVRDIDRGDVMIPETDIVVAPRFLGDEAAAEDADEPEGEAARRQRLADWLTGPQNPYFARATVNRVWGLLFGRGVVDPIDDFGIENPPISPELLDALASQLIDSDFDLKKVIRTIALSKAYRLSSSSGQVGEAEATVAKRLETFAQMNVKTLTAEQLYDCIAVATLLDQDTGSAGEYTLARFGNSQRDEFLQRFAAPANNRAEYLAGIPQALMLMNGSLITGATGEGTSGLLKSLEAPFFTDRQRIDVLFMATLSRPAGPEEFDLVSDFVPADASQAERSAGLADLLWALINSAEFTLNH